MQMIATKLILSQEAIKRLRISDAYSIHRVVYSLFDRSTVESHRILYSDLGGDFFNHSVLIISDRTPNVDNLAVKVVVNSKPIPDNLFRLGYYRFRTKINVSKKDSKTKKIVPIRNKEEIINWFVQKSPNVWGFSPLNNNLEIEKIEALNFKGKNNQEVYIHQVTLAGILKVADLDKFKKSFSLGLGRGKAFGCGLLEIYPITNINN